MATKTTTLLEELFERDTPFDASTLLRQIGAGNVLAISGGISRIVGYPNGIDMPAGKGYRVVIHLAGNDTYTVRRVYRRGGVNHVHGEQTDVYADQVGEQAYQAACYHHPWPA